MEVLEKGVAVAGFTTVLAVKESFLLVHVKVRVLSAEGAGSNQFFVC